MLGSWHEGEKNFNMSLRLEKLCDAISCLPKTQVGGDINLME